MALEVGSRLGHYDVTALIGEGGMGQVYQATDTKLNRQVALKILPEAFATDPDRLARFQREAQVLASLNHPNIGHIYGLEEAEGQKALVLELIEGPTLADRIKQGPIPVDEALPIQSYVATLVERHSRYVCLVRLAGRTTRTVVRALTQHVRRLPDGLMATLTWDRGLELAAHRTFSIATGVQVYFCDPYSPWQRGTNENTNGLLRQYLPKGTDLARYTQAQLDRIARELNTRPRKTLGYRTPADILAETVASTG